VPGGGDGHLPHLTVKRLRRRLDRDARYPAGLRIVGERTLADASRDEGAERENEQRWDGLRPETN
jgi:hypothetical protein